ncbi:MAG: CRTAC1 family protein, partial [Bacteroidetes bacterium]
LDNDGDQDIFIEMGGAFLGDAYPSAFYLNPGQTTNNWICLKLEGTTSNRAAIGASLTLKFRENGKVRQVYREVNAGGSFGCAPFRREIGVGQATVIDEISIFWPASKTRQVFQNVPVNQFLRITEGRDDYETLEQKKLVFKKADGTIPMCAPIQ